MWRHCFTSSRIFFQQKFHTVVQVIFYFFFYLKKEEKMAPTEWAEPAPAAGN